jgi:CDP-diacylglycerol--glycerol-3-phosphate 3-phosphatidyltransferase
VDLDDYLARWQALHGGYDPRAARLTGAWLRVVHRVATPLAARRVSPDAVTWSSLVPAAAAVATAYAGGRWPILGAFLVVAGGVLDGVDGAVAAMTDRSTRFGFVLDSLADRVVDGLLLMSLWLLGAPGGLAIGAGAALVLLEYTRARAGFAGMSEIGIVTVGERPTRLVLAAMTFLVCGLVPGHEAVAAAGAGATLAACLAGLAQLLPVVRRTLR